MKFKNLILACSALCLVVFSGCKKEDDTEDSVALKETTNRTVLMYLFQDTNLSEHLTNNINDLELGWNPDIDGTMLVYVDPSTHKTQFDGKPVLLEITNDSTQLIVSRIVKVYEDADATNPDVFRKVQEDAIALFPAEQYGLIFSGHGDGFFVSDNSESKGLGNSDRWGNNKLDIDQIAKNAPVHYDFIIFDACLMGESTTLYQLRNVTDYVVASVELSPGEGFAYRTALAALFTQPKADLPTFGQETFLYYQTDTYGKEQMGKEGYMTLGIYRMSGMNKLAEATKKSIAALNFNHGELYNRIGSIIENPEEGIRQSMYYPNDEEQGGSPMFYDFGLLKRLLLYSNEIPLANELSKALKSVVIQTYVASTEAFNKNNPKYEDMSENISFYIPSINPEHKFQDNAFYTRYEWSAASGFTKEKESFL